ncbi:hypothetical protein A0O28_0090100 [Trichoderma guizhouense]|uniref:Uncharacterized protein n=1 Tax=Trichoderma guizhouense TaxID=1491466 RepID=A0A1T3CUY2_9HYPO|nr:hypothetical protein A0O28_0090100 [Trichoderma guizhouense]
MYSIIHRNSMAGNTELINSLTIEQARGILIYLSQNDLVAKKCSATFDPSDTAKNCFYHNGELEPDYDGDFWADHDENCHGTIDTDEMRDEFPEGFIWSCCDKGGDDIGCRWGRHQSDPNKVEDGEDADLYDEGWDDDDDDLDDEDEDDEEEVDDEDHGNKRSNGDESQDSGPNKRQKL